MADNTKSTAEGMNSPFGKMMDKIGSTMKEKVLPKKKKLNPFK